MNKDAIRMPIEILLVADEEGRLIPLEEQLTEVAPFQFIIDCAATVQEAGGLMAGKPYDIILLDLSAPDGSGQGMYRMDRHRGVHV